MSFYSARYSVQCTYYKNFNYYCTIYFRAKFVSWWLSRWWRRRSHSHSFSVLFSSGCTNWQFFFCQLSFPFDHDQATLFERWKGWKAFDDDILIDEKITWNLIVSTNFWQEKLCFFFGQILKFLEDSMDVFI